MNEITLIGHVVTAPTYHCTEEAQDLTRITIATTDRNGQCHTHHCVAWGQAAIDLHRFLKPKNQLMIRGELRYRKHRVAGKTLQLPVIYVRGYTFLDARRNVRQTSSLAV